MLPTVGWNDVSWNNPDVVMPNLEGLASQGLILENNYVQPTCSPSRYENSVMDSWKAREIRIREMAGQTQVWNGQLVQTQVWNGQPS